MLNDIDILQQKLIFYTLWKKVDVKLAFLYSCIKKSILCRYYRPGHPNRDFHSTYAFIKKATIFTQSWRNFVKIR